MAYKVLDILKDLPGTNCKDCGKTGCFAFATGVYLDGAPLSGCPHLSPGKLEEMEARLAEGRNRGEGKKEASHVQALVFLKDKIAGMNFAQMAEKSDASFDPGPPETLSVHFLGCRHLITPDEVTALEGEAPSVWVKVFLYIYSTRANGNKAAGRWISFRELPNSVSKAKTFEKVVDGVAAHYADNPEALDDAVRALGGAPTDFGSAERAWLIKALPRVDLLLLFWGKGEEFGARTSLLMDAGILDYLDHEAIVFLAEAFVKRLTGGNVGEVIP